MTSRRPADEATARLVDMANQIAMSVPDRDRAAEETAAHLRAFWTPAMIRSLDERAATGRSGLRAEVTDALALLRGTTLS